jgi:ElaB/YqjD/DUF883 family membrane-anchored ribosome-binding protein
MDQTPGDSQRNIEGQQAVMTENMGRVEERVQETVDGLKSTVHKAMEGFKQIQETVNGAKTAVDGMLESVKGTVDETVERVKPTADLLDYVQHNPWLLVGSAVLMGISSALSPVRIRLAANYQLFRSWLGPAEIPNARVSLLASCAAEPVDDFRDRCTISNSLLCQSGF